MPEDTGLAQTLLALIKGAEQEAERIEQDFEPDDMNGRILQGVITHVRLKAKIKELCQEHLQKEVK